MLEPSKSNFFGKGLHEKGWLGQARGCSASVCLLLVLNVSQMLPPKAEVLIPKWG